MLKTPRYRLTVSVLFILLIAIGWSGLQKVLISNLDYSDFARSDGRGYYAYLPAILLQKDPTYQSILSVENRYHPEKGEGLFLHPAKGGHVVNKYFPGTALLLSPFFTIACLHAEWGGHPTDGYSPPFGFWMHTASLFYTLLGLFLLHLVLQIRGTTVGKRIHIVLLLLATPLLFYSVFHPTLSHQYSFFLFAWLTYLLSRNRLRWILISLTIVLIALVRPTNILAITIIPFLFRDWIDWKSLFRAIPATQIMWVTTLPILATALWASLNYWQTGQWLVWSYAGEGFNWANPKIWQTLFSFRIGIFWQHPVLLLSFIVLMGSIKKSDNFRFPIAWIGWALVFYVISTWWCWDYASNFGHRAFVEYGFLLLWPFSRFRLPDQWWKRALWQVAFFLVIALQLLRFHQWKTGIFVVQRFTAQTYFNSLGAWGPSDVGRFHFNQFCEPKGELIYQKVVVPIDAAVEIHAGQPFIATCDFIIPDAHLSTQKYISVKIDKRLNQQNAEDMLLVVDATNSINTKRYYWTSPIVNDSKLERGERVQSEISTVLHDLKGDWKKIRVYLWNRGASGEIYELNYCLALFDLKD